MTPKFFNRPKLFWVAAAILLLSGAAYSARVGVRHVRSRINEARAEVVKRDAKIADLNGKLVGLNGKLEKTTRSTQERMDGYSREVVFLSEQLRDAISPLPLCDGGEIGLTNSSFSPPIGYEVGDQSAKSEHRLVDSGAALLEAVDLTERPMMAAHLSVADGALHVDVKAPLTGPEFHDLALLVRSGASICKLRARLHFLPARASNGDTYKIVSVISRRGYGLGKFTLPYGTEFRSDNGNLLVSDCINALIQEFGLRGNLVNVYGSFGNFDQQFNRPAAVRFADGKIYVVEENNARFQILSGDGRFLHLGGADSGKLKNPKEKPGYFSTPLGIAVTKAGNIIVVDHGNNRVQELGPNGGVKFITVNQAGDPFEFKDPYYVTIDPTDGDILVSNRGYNEIAVMAADGTKKRSFGRGILNYPHELAFGPDHSLYVADLYNYRVAIFKDASDEHVSFEDFPRSWGFPKTVAVNKDGLLAVGFAGAGEAFVVLMSPDAKFHLAMKPQEPSPRVASLLMKAGFSASSAHARSPASLYSRYCTNCHENGNYGAPKRQSAEWNRFPRDVAALLPIAKSGIGAMIPKGGCSDCTDEELKNLIKFMLPSWNE